MNNNDKSNKKYGIQQIVTKPSVFGNEIIRNIDFIKKSRWATI